MNKKVALIIIGFVALGIIAGIACLKFLPNFGVKEDAAVYDVIAVNLSSGRGFAQNNSPSADTPGYPFFLSLIYSILGHNFIYVKIIQFAILGLIGGATYLISKNFLKINPVLALLSGITVIFWPYFLLYSNLLLTEILFTFFLIVSTILVLIFQKKPSYLTALLLGTWLGITALIRPTALLLPFWIALTLIIFWPTFRQTKNLKKLVLMCLVFLACLVPWILRDYVVFDKFIPNSPKIWSSNPKKLCPA